MFNLNETKLHLKLFHRATVSQHHNVVSYTDTGSQWHFGIQNVSFRFTSILLLHAHSSYFKRCVKCGPHGLVFQAIRGLQIGINTSVQ